MYNPHEGVCYSSSWQVTKLCPSQRPQNEPKRRSSLSSHVVHVYLGTIDPCRSHATASRAS